MTKEKENHLKKSPRYFGEFLFGEKYKKVTSNEENRKQKTETIIKESSVWGRTLNFSSRKGMMFQCVRICFCRKNPFVL